MTDTTYKHNHSLERRCPSRPGPKVSLSKTPRANSFLPFIYKWVAAMPDVQ